MMAGYDPAGALIEGDPKTPRQVTEIWTFARDIQSNDPNWLLASDGKRRLNGVTKACDFGYLPYYFLPCCSPDARRIGLHRRSLHAAEEWFSRTARARNCLDGGRPLRSSRLA